MKPRQISTHCRRRWCGAKLTERHDRALGRIEFVCEPCARNARGLCRECDQPLPKRRSMRCAACARRFTKVRDRANHVLRYRKDAAFRKAQCDYQKKRRTNPAVQAADKAWRAKQPKPQRTIADLIYERAYSKTHPLSRAQKDRRNALARARHAANPEKHRARNRKRREDPITRAIDNAKQLIRCHARRAPNRVRKPVDLDAMLAAATHAQAQFKDSQSIGRAS